MLGNTMESRSVPDEDAALAAAVPRRTYARAASSLAEIVPGCRSVRNFIAERLGRGDNKRSVYEKLCVSARAFDAMMAAAGLSVVGRKPIQFWKNIR